MNRVQFLDSLRRQLDDLPSRQREEIVEVYSKHIQDTVAKGVSEREAVDKLGTPAACARDARAGRLPGAAVQSAAPRKSSNPFEPRMAAKPQRVKAQRLDRERQRHPEEPQGKKPWALVIAVTVAALLCVAFVLLRVISSDGGLGYTQKEQSFPIDQVQRIVVEDSNKAIRISALTSTDIRVNYYEGHHESYELQVEDGTLYVKSLVDRKWYDTLLSFYDSTVPVLNLYLPPDFGGDISLTTSNGNIEVLGALETGALTLCSSNGSISLTDTTAQSLTAVTSNSPIELSRVTADEGISLTGSNSGLTLQNVDCAALTLQTSNGSISGELVGRAEDYTVVESHTSNGSNRNPARPGGERQLHLRTSNGSIKVEFMG